MSENPTSTAAARHTRREQLLRHSGGVIGHAIAFVAFIGALGVCVVILRSADDHFWTSASLFTIFLGMVLRALWWLVDPSKRNKRLAVPLAYFTAAVFAASSVAGLGAMLVESFAPAIILAPAALVIAIFLAVVARALSVERHAA